MTVPWTEAWEEAIASCPVDVQLHITLEFQHPQFVEAGLPVAPRVTLGAVDQVFGIEPGAVMDAGEMVTFQACAFSAEPPEVGEGKVPSCKISVDNVARWLTPLLNAAVLVRADLWLVYREYRDDDRSEPAYGPVRFVLRDVTVNSGVMEGTASLKDLANLAVPSLVYTRKAFSSLVAG